MNYSEARALMSRARHPENGKPLRSNARLYERDYSQMHPAGAQAYAVKLYNTDIVTILKDGTYILKTGTWETTQTRDGIFEFAPVTWHNVIKRDGAWWLRTRPNDKDPEPKVMQRTVPHPFWAISPGPEPVKGTFDCLAGTRYATTTVEKRSLWLDGSPYLGKLELGDRADFDFNAAPNRARSVTAYLKKNERYVYFTRAVTRVIDYSDVHDRGVTCCPHCAAFASVMYRWREANREWERFTRHMDEHGGYAGWRDAAREDLRRLKEENATWSAWDERNRIPLDGTRIGSDGYPLRQEVDAYFKEQRRLAREQRRRVREAEAAARHERHIARLKSGYMQRREAQRPRFERIAHEIANDLVEAREMIAAAQEGER